MGQALLKRTFGEDADELFAYETARIVRIKDVRLGCMYILLVLLILCYVVVFQIAFANEHFKRRDVHGTARITIQQPTKFCNPNKAGCESNFHSLKDLPYCKLYDGSSAVVEEKYKQRNVEAKGCQPSEENEYTCNNEFIVDEHPAIVYVADIERFTVLIAHSYHRDTFKGSNTLLEGHYFECIESETDKEDSKWSEAIFGAQECRGKLERKPINCINDKCKELKGIKEKTSSFLQTEWSKSDGDQEEEDWVETNPEMHLSLGSIRRPVAGRKRSSALSTSSNVTVPPHSDASVAALATAKAAGRPDVGKFNPPDIFAIPDGDIFKISKLLDLAGGLDLDKTINHYGEPLRESGTVLELEVIYQNLKPWSSWVGQSEVRYDYKVKQRPMEEMKTELFAQAQPFYPEKRVMENRHGIYLIVKISGEFGFFSVVYTVIMLTTAAGLVGAAVFLTDKISIYCLAQKSEYYKFKYKEEYCIEEVDPSKQQSMQETKASV